MKTENWAIMVAAAAVAFTIAPTLTEPFQGYSADQLPYPQTDRAIQPPGWAFSIWGVIYLWMVAGSLYGVWKARGNPRWAAMRPPLFVALALGTFWLAIANASPLLATLAIVLMAGFAVVALLRTTDEDWWWQAAPVALFAGWLTAATGVGTAIVLAGYGVLSGTAAGIAALFTVLVAGFGVLAAKPGAWPYALAVGWALFGITVGGLGGDERIVPVIAGLGLVVLTVKTVRGVLR
ncbi:tryptophan-rich sensory protein [Amaricoccus tamworthensis]|uniref:tryptophan-rich sensory protein n=1 Tax=Amaricoccus tamworthensis TaxID=57002 RepID=UPI003C7E45E0